jgi:site-specific DNA-cytosine methylase
MNYPTAIPDKAMARLHASYVIETNGCWRWTRAKTTAGYGHFHVFNRYYQAHRLVYTLLRGAVTTAHMDHLCRNRACVNPDHLEPVSHRENVRRGGGTRLTVERVRAIHELADRGLSQREIGRLMGVDHSTVCRVLRGSRWSEYQPIREKAA